MPVTITYKGITKQIGPFATLAIYSNFITFVVREFNLPNTLYAATLTTIDDAQTSLCTHRPERTDTFKIHKTIILHSGNGKNFEFHLMETDYVHKCIIL